MATSKRKPTRIPKLQHHKPTGQAKVVLSGRTFYLGPYGSDEAEVQYRALTTEWLQNGRMLLPEPEEITVTELIAQYVHHTEAYYDVAHAPGPQRRRMT